MKNKGKEFEGDFKQSCQLQKIWVHRENDTYMSLVQENDSSFTPSNIADFLMFKLPYLYVVECKSTTYKRMSIQSEEDAKKKKKKMIQWKQIQNLIEASQYEGIFAGFLLNFRNDENIRENYVYWMDISDFCEFLSKEKMKSISREDCEKYGGVLVKQSLKRVHFTYDIGDLIPRIKQRGDEIEVRITNFLTEGIKDLDDFFSEGEEEE